MGHFCPIAFREMHKDKTKGISTGEGYAFCFIFFRIFRALLQKQGQRNLGRPVEDADSQVAVVTNFSRLLRGTSSGLNESEKFWGEVKTFSGWQTCTSLFQGVLISLKKIK